MSYRTLTISLVYNRPEIVEKSIEQFYRTTLVPTTHVLVDQCWPLEREKMEHVFQRLSERHGCQILRPGKNLGLARGFNWALDQVPFPDNGAVIGYDPDSWPVTQGWDLALCQAFDKYSEAAWFSLWHPHAERELLAEKRGHVDESDPSIVWADRAVMNSVCAFHRGWLAKVGGLRELNPRYGGLEVHTWPRLVEAKRRWLFLRDFREEFWPWPEMVDLNYRLWKIATTQGGEVQIDFADWIKKKV